MEDGTPPPPQKVPVDITDKSIPWTWSISVDSHDADETGSAPRNSPPVRVPFASRDRLKAELDKE